MKNGSRFCRTLSVTPVLHSRRRSARKFAAQNAAFPIRKGARNIMVHVLVIALCRSLQSMQHELQLGDPV